MWFLLRMAFWLGLVLVLLPRDKTQESQKVPQISASEAVQAATAAVSDMSQFCKRQPAACEVGGEAATVIGARAQEGARKIYQMMTDKKAGEADKKPGDADRKDADRKPAATDKKPGEPDKKAPDHTGSIGGVDPAFADLASQDTLLPDDLLAEWRGAP